VEKPRGAGPSVPAAFVEKGGQRQRVGWDAAGNDSELYGAFDKAAC
jgi:hypothetical protein